MAQFEGDGSKNSGKRLQLPTPIKTKLTPLKSNTISDIYQNLDALPVLLKFNLLSLVKINLPLDASVVDEKIRVKYSIVFRRSNKTLLVWEHDDETEARIRFNDLMKICQSIYTNASLQRSNSVKFVQKLIETMKSHPNWTALHVAAYHGLLEFFKKNVFTAQELNAQYAPDYLTPLHLAVQQQFRMTVEAILYLNPDVTLADKDHNTVLHISLDGNMDIFKLFINHPLSNQLLKHENINGRNPIDLICLNNKKDHLIYLMKMGLTARMLTSVDQKQKTFLPTIDDKKKIIFVDRDFTYIDFNRIKSGGCPLHWTSEKKMLKKLLKYFSKETINYNNETPLMVMIKNQDLSCTLLLLFNDANTNCPDSNGDYPLHIAVKNGNLSIIKSLIVFDSDVNQINSIDGLNPIQLAEQQQKTRKDIVELFDFYKEAKNTTNVVPPGNPFYLYQSKLHKYKCVNNGKKPKSRMICLDGGGVKGLFTVQMLIELQKYLKKDLNSYFDWFSGTSTGSMIAFYMIKKPLIEIRRLYFHFKDEILTGSRPYNSSKIESLFKEVGADIPLRDIYQNSGKHLIITATRVNQYPPTLQLFCSHGCTTNRMAYYPPTLLVWQALRASCAAPTFFRQYFPFIDGGIISNNPTLDSLTEYFRFKFMSSEDCKEPDLDLVLSVGTGFIEGKCQNFGPFFDKFNYFLDFRNFIRGISQSPWTIGNELASQMKLQVTNCNDHIVQRSACWCNCLDMHFFRLNAQVRKKIQLDETKDEELLQILWDLKLSCFRMADFLKNLAQILDEE